MNPKYLLAVLLLAAASASAENVKLTLRVDKLKAGTETVEVTLGHGFAIDARDGNTVILDFDRRLRFEGTTVASLFAEVAGRELHAAQPVRNVRREEKDGVVRFRRRSAELGEYTTETLPDSAEQAAAFTRFIRHQYGGPPELLAELEQLGGIPRRLKLETYEIAIEDAVPQPDEAYATPADATFGLAADERWGPVLASAAALDPEVVRSRMKKVEQAADAAFVQGRPLAAFLLYVESQLTLGDLPAGLEENGPVLLAYEAVARVRDAIAPLDAKSARKGLAILADARASVPEAAHILRIFEANIHSSYGEERKAYEDFHAVLSEHPAIVGAWHDLGMLFVNDDQATAAWDCWEAARRIAPGHGMLRGIDYREAELLAKYPGFF
jgi:hypothetical protein